MNERFVLTVANAALEDIAAAREAHGSDSASYRDAADHACRYIRGSLEDILRAAIPHLERRSAQTQGQP